MRLPSIFRRTPFRLTLLFLALFATTSSALLAYIYVATAAEARRRADQDVRRELAVLESVYSQRGKDALNAALVERTLRGGPYLFLMMDSERRAVTGNISESPIEDAQGPETWASFRISDADQRGRVVRRSARGVEVALAGGERLFVGEDIGDTEAHLARVTQALWGAGALVVLLGLGGGLLISRNVERHMAGLNRVVSAVEEGDMHARATLRGSKDEFDELAGGINHMLDRLEQSMAGLRHAGDAVAHDLRSPLTRMRAKLEVALIEVEAGKGDPRAALETALDEADGLLKTFNTVLAIARLQAAGQAPDPVVFDAAELAADMAELYEPASEDKGLQFQAEVHANLPVRGNRAFVAQALANVIDNAIKYTPEGGAVMLRARRRSSGEVEFSVTDTGPGVPDEDRLRVVQRFVRLENSRSEPGSGLGLSLVAAVAEAHGGRLELDEGPGKVGEMGPGLRVALVFPPAPIA
ncbi:ATP-binding protein [Caulobacter sp. 17J65-9]|uniref:sensor histidine kinase n=1 Tax=Caulobacter sp. 17J65-9 TaxID=2709382 RepID=UPI0013C57222|nr:ATP-binding protein [Caulobacter sp. 17J65-9]NEX93845.1 HAMP domain-containing protein [Caulobacter sp. 17J65-9]